MRIRIFGWLALMASIGVACGGDGGSGGNGPSRTIAKGAAPNGDNQVGIAADTLNDTIRVLVTEDGEPVVGFTVGFAAQNNGTVAPTAALTNADGVASAVWILGPTNGPQTLRATLTRATGSPLTFTATAFGANGVLVGNNYFRSNTNGTEDPAVDTIFAGETLTWRNTLGTHTVQSQGAPSFPSSGNLIGTGTSHTALFTTEGTYQYDCAIHGAAMTGRVVVLPAEEEPEE